MLSTRFTGKLSRWGNYLGILNTVLSGAIDYILGNKAAIITYPVTFLITHLQSKNGKNLKKVNLILEAKTQTKLIATIATITAFYICLHHKLHWLRWKHEPTSLCNYNCICAISYR